MGTYPLLFAAGAVGLSRAFARRPRLGVALGSAWVAVLLISGAALAPLALPVLHVESYREYAAFLGEQPSTEENKEVGSLPQSFADMHGWEELASAVQEVVDALGPEDRRDALVFVGNYGEAGALRRFGRNLPPVLSGHNSHWMWGPQILEQTNATGEVTVVLGGSRQGLEQRFGRVELAGRSSCRYCMPYENDVPIWVAREPFEPIRVIWPGVKHYD